MATLYIHIGTPKTGSTSIQNFLKMNEQALERHGVIHPVIDIPEITPKSYRTYRNANFLVFESRLQDGDRGGWSNPSIRRGLTLFSNMRKMRRNWSLQKNLFGFANTGGRIFGIM